MSVHAMSFLDLLGGLRQTFDRVQFRGMASRAQRNSQMLLSDEPISHQPLREEPVLAAEVKPPEPHLIHAPDPAATPHHHHKTVEEAL